MEDWNDGYRKDTIPKFFTHYSIIPPFHRQDLTGGL
jgi:hypothetical protein